MSSVSSIHSKGYMPLIIKPLFSIVQTEMPPPVFLLDQDERRRPKVARQHTLHVMSNDTLLSA